MTEYMPHRCLGVLRDKRPDSSAWVRAGREEQAVVPYHLLPKKSTWIPCAKPPQQQFRILGWHGWLRLYNAWEASDRHRLWWELLGLADLAPTEGQQSTRKVEAIHAIQVCGIFVVVA